MSSADVWAVHALKEISLLPEDPYRIKTAVLLVGLAEAYDDGDDLATEKMKSVLLGGPASDGWLESGWERIRRVNTSDRILEEQYVDWAERSVSATVEKEVVVDNEEEPVSDDDFLSDEESSSSSSSSEEEDDEEEEGIPRPPGRSFFTKPILF